MAMSSLPPMEDLDDDDLVFGTDKDQDLLDVDVFNPVEYINKQFPNEASLKGLDDFVQKLKARKQQTDDEIRLAIRRQAATGRRARADLDEAKGAVRELFERIRTIKSKAQQSEELVKEVCAEIKELDLAKRNLTLTITTLKRLVMLVTALEQLRAAGRARNYEEASKLLYAVEELAGHFADLRHISRVQDLLEKKCAVLDDLKQQVLDDYRSLLSGGAEQADLPEDWTVGAAHYVDALGAKMRQEVVTRFCLGLLEEYKDIFQPPKEDSRLEMADRRFAWLDRMLLKFEERYSTIFPSSWKIPQALCEHFCHITRQHLVELLSTSHHSIDPELLVRTLRRSIDYENKLARKFPVEPAEEEEAAAASSGDFVFRFKGIISECFDAYLSTWVQHEERQLMEILDRSTASTSERLTKNYEEDQEDEEEEGAGLLYSSAPSIFSAMKVTMTKCTEFSTRGTLFDIFKVFQKVMVQYVDKLKNRLPDKLTAPMEQQATEAACCVIGTSEYCDETLPLLAEQLTNLISEEYQERITFGQEQDLLGALMRQANQVLVQSVNCSLDEAFGKMKRTNWESYSQDVGDHSIYVAEISEQLAKYFAPIAVSLSKIHYRFFCDQFVQFFVKRYIEEIYRCRKISEQGAQQLLLDTTLIKTTLLETPVVAGNGGKMQTAYSNYVLREMGRAEAMLKVLSSPDIADPAQVVAMLGEERSAAEIDRLLALRASSDVEPPLAHEDGALGASSIGSTMLNLGDSLNQKGLKASEDLRKNFMDMKKNVHKLGFGGVNLPSFGGRKTGGASSSGGP
mmetsp:Transcript_26841/g.56887  ORF Transcript_26841/g.56887 Transcript_26841/m.56887 type:complete len:798 (-) Transcript_26841:48-2441(-)